MFRPSYVVSAEKMHYDLLHIYHYLQFEMILSGKRRTNRRRTGY